MKVHIEQIARKPKTFSNGRQGTLVGIKVNGVWWNGFGGDWNSDWKVGDTVEVELTEKPGADGKKYKNFDRPDPIKALEARIERLESLVAGMAIAPSTKSYDDMPNFDEEPF